MTVIALVTGEDAASVTERFNAFHDGFIQTVSIRSRDWFSQEGSDPWEVGHHVTGEFDAVIEFAHYNYGGQIQPLGRIIRGSFADVVGFRLDLRDVAPSDWPIQFVEMEPARRRRALGGDEACFRLVINWSYMDGEEWGTRTQELFTFREAEFEEHDGS